MPLAPVRRTSASSEAFEQLIDEVLSGATPPGQTLPPERALTELLKVNRQAVREALQRLAQAGLVEIQHGGGTRVLDHRKSASMDLLPRLLVRPDGELDVDVAHSIIEVRDALGPVVARASADRADGAVIARLESALAEAEEATELEDLARLDLSFWDAIVDGSRNIAYRLAFNSLRRTYEPMIDVLLPVLAVELRAWDVRRSLVAAIQGGRGDDAAGAAETLLKLGGSALSGWLDGGGR